MPKIKQINSFLLRISNAFTNRLDVAILRLPNGLDYSEINQNVNPIFKPFNGLMSQSSVITLDSFNGSVNNTGELTILRAPHLQLMHVDSNLNLAEMASSQSTITEPQPGKIYIIYTYDK